MEKKRTARAEVSSAYRTEQAEPYQYIGYFYPKKRRRPRVAVRRKGTRPKQVAVIFTHGVATVRPILKLLKDYKLVVIGDREYRSTAFALWLTKKNIDFVLRLNKNTKIKPRYQKYQCLNSLEIKPGSKVLYNDVLVTEDHQKNRFNVVVYWRRKYNNKQLPSPWYLLTNLKNKEEVMRIFASRGGIEAMFRDCKSGGYNLEGSQANPQRLTNLILLIAITQCQRS